MVIRMSAPFQKVPSDYQREMAARVVFKVVGRSLDGTALWERWVGEISRAIAANVWSDPFVSEENDMAAGSKP